MFEKFAIASARISWCDIAGDLRQRANWFHHQDECYREQLLVRFCLKSNNQANSDISCRCGFFALDISLFRGDRCDQQLARKTNPTNSFSSITNSKSKNKTYIHTYLYVYAFDAPFENFIFGFRLFFPIQCVHMIDPDYLVKRDSVQFDRWKSCTTT